MLTRRLVFAALSVVLIVGLVPSAAQAAPGDVMGRHIFYNNSAWDAKDPNANAQDDNALAPDKQALLPGGTATFANYTSYSRGINGIMVDIDSLPGTPTTADFEFRVGNDNNPVLWAAAPAPSSISVRAGAGVSGSDRVTIIWSDNAIQNQWLQVTVLATANTGLSCNDVFYWGNAIGESGNSPADAAVTAIDALHATNAVNSQQGSVPIDYYVDYNRDGAMSAFDVLIAINNQTDFLTALQLITVPAGPSCSLGSISGMKFNDLDDDGVLDPGEPGLSGWQIELREYGIGEIGDLLATTVTDDNGEYTFAGLVDGGYTVWEVQQLGWTQTAPGPQLMGQPVGVHTITIDGGQKVTDVDFGNQYDGGKPPIPELPTYLLFGSGLVAIAGFLGLRKLRQQRTVETS